jgi:hypothetical protein
VTTFNEFKVGLRYARADGVIVLITRCWRYTKAKNGDTAGLVTGDDGIERWDDPEPGYGICTSISDPLMNLIPGAIAPGKKHAGPLKIR